jgi:simple sugar transport system permease protein
VSTPDISHMDGFNSLGKIFSSSFEVGGVTIWGTVIWWFVFVAISGWILQRTRVGTARHADPSGLKDDETNRNLGGTR